MPENTTVRELWDRTHLALLPWTRVPADELHARALEAVTAAVTVQWGGCDDALLDAPATDAQVHAIVAARTAYGYGWRDAVLGDVAADARAAGLGPGPGGLWAPAGRRYLGRGRASRPTLRQELEFVARHPWATELERLRAVRSAVEASPADPRATLASLYRTAWTDRATERLGWDDAEWWQYLYVAELTAWAVVALGLPAQHPADAGTAVEDAADAVSPHNWTWTGAGLPDGFLDAAFEALGL
ncbi:hypothetical protein [Streptomyces lavendulae]|uniref:hypothetical protein n=1 Tax=Streptomyces lavendulae TaxID=1914 RepID=UPI0024A1E861|nr:hypothetical protein [Streptomyces lavendulae]GLX24014.1 hypothetical protein Slala01_76580 [Streptomyces lavendulae subsp. lavendulae]GLX31913.1 hypothetical protein Slala02_77320 [Streptomyces lavendulae subsp. lavendulae]